MHSRCVAVELVCLSEEVVELTVLFVSEKIPLELLVCVPLVELTDFTAHEHELLARVSKHVGDEASYALELLVVVAGHLID